jgi:tRNA dimethylallyltransferase
MQIYRGMDIGTAKPGPETRARIPHHLIDIYDISQAFGVYTFAELARKTAEDIAARGKLPIISGGTGFYINALLEGLDPLPADPEIRAGLEREYAGDDGFERLAERVRRDDPEDFDPDNKNKRKLIRALEVLLITGSSLASLKSGAGGRPDVFRNAVVWALFWDREELRRRIERRTSEMLAAGWIEETKTLIDMGLESSPTARQAIGYAQTARFLRGEMSRADMEREISVKTWQFARRQVTWLRNKTPVTRRVMMPQSPEELDKLLDSDIGH